MKILKVRFENLNSLTGEWSIDFTSPEYVSDGIFAITGPTGAGKSTIMDAICLALYGMTPRLRSITKNENEIMSRLTGSCMAEVIFETTEGIFCACWSQNRARGKHDGALQQPRHELSDAVTNILISSQLTTTSREIEERTGMDFNRFIQSMMLAQGGFAKFLQAKGSDRAPILEQITGAEIYSEISKQVHIIHKERKTDYDLTARDLMAINLLSEEDEQLLMDEIKTSGERKAVMNSRLTILYETLEWFRKIRDLKNALELIAKGRLEVEEQIRDFEPESQKLKRAQKALLLEADHSMLIGQRDQQQNDLGAMESHNKALALNNEKVEEYTKDHAASTQALNEVKKQQSDLIKIVQLVTVLDTEIKLMNLELTQKSEKKKILTAEHTTLTESIEKIKSAIKEMQDDLDVKGEYLRQNSSDAELVEELQSIELKLNSLSVITVSIETLKKDMTKNEDLLKAINKAEGEFRLQWTECNKSVDKSIETSKVINDQIARLLGESDIETYEKRKEELLIEKSKSEKVESLEEERKLLTDHEPCPLCGSPNHPYAKGNIPQTSKIQEELNQLNLIIDRHKVLSIQQGQAVEERSRLEKLVAEYQRKTELEEVRKTGCTQNIEKQKENLQQLTDTKESVIASLVIILSKYKTELPTENEHDISELNRSLKIRKETYITYQKACSELDKTISRLQAECDASEVLSASKRAAMEGLEKEVEKIGISLSDLLESRRSLFGDKDTEKEQQTMTELLKSAEENVARTFRMLEAETNEIVKVKALVSDLLTRTTKRAAELTKLEESFAALLTKHGFSGEGEFISVRLTESERNALRKRETELLQRLNELNALKEDKEKSLAEEKAKNLSNEDAHLIQDEYSNLKTEIDTLSEEIGNLRGKLENNENQKERGEQLKRDLQVKKQEYERWLNLNELIGSADGKKYRNFVQALTLEVMITHANMQLEKFCDRYQLVRDTRDGLELNIVDLYQAGEVRSTRNLSGGESFIVSLALALGLSGMASQKVKVDSLFLDEGFDTLDEETLETVLVTLTGLQQTGKMIGVISHVNALKERINTKITVVPQREGRSILMGPGCNKRMRDSLANI